MGDCPRSEGCDEWQSSEPTRGRRDGTKPGQNDRADPGKREPRRRSREANDEPGAGRSHVLNRDQPPKIAALVGSPTARGMMYTT